MRVNRHVTEITLAGVPVLFFSFADLCAFLQIEAGQFADSSIMCGFLQHSEKSKIWQKCWCVIPEKESLVLYLYGAPQVKQLLQAKNMIGYVHLADHSQWRRSLLWLSSQDVKAQCTIPLVGYSVDDTTRPTDPPASFHISQSKSTHNFAAETEELKQRWLKVIRVAVKGEIPERPETNGSGVSDNNNTEEASTDNT